MYIRLPWQTLVYLGKCMKWDTGSCRQSLTELNWTESWNNTKLYPGHFPLNKTCILLSLSVRGFCSHRIKEILWSSYIYSKHIETSAANSLTVSSVSTSGFWQSLKKVTRSKSWVGVVLKVKALFVVWWRGRLSNVWLRCDMSPIHERHICWPLWTSIPACILETYQTNVISVKECDSLGFALNTFKKSHKYKKQWSQQSIFRPVQSVLALDVFL